MSTSEAVLPTLPQQPSQTWKPLARWAMWAFAASALMIAGLLFFFESAPLAASILPVVFNVLLFTLGLTLIMLVQKARLSGSIMMALLAGEFVLKLLVTLGLLALAIYILDWPAGLTVTSFLISFVVLTVIRLVLLFPILRQTLAPEERGES